MKTFSIRMRPNIMIAVVAAMFIFLIISPVLAKYDNFIVGGKRVGPVMLGKPLSKFAKFLGPRKTSNPKFFDFPRRGMALLVKNGIIEGIYVYSPGYKTKKGIRVGSSVNVLKKKYGNYLKTESGAMIYTDIGLAFNEKDYKITRIMVVYPKPDPLLGDKLIVPGVRVGNIRLGMEIGRVKLHWGKPTTIENMGKKSKFSIYKYNKKGMKIIVESGIVAGAQVLSYKYRTPEGIGVKSSRQQVIKTYGKRFKSIKDSINYKSMGIGFYFHNGEVIEILLSPRSE